MCACLLWLSAVAAEKISAQTIEGLPLRRPSPAVLAITPTSAEKEAEFVKQLETERARLAIGDKEVKRDALQNLASLARPESSRVAVAGLSDASEIVRATAARAVIYLPPAELFAALSPLLKDKNAFVRQEVVYAFGLGRNAESASALQIILLTDKESGVRAACAVALGQIGANHPDAAGANALLAALDGKPPPNLLSDRERKKFKPEKNIFVKRAAAHSLGQLGNHAAVPSLIALLSDAKSTDDERREAARSLGCIGDPSASPALREFLAARDPYLARLAYEILQQLAAQ